MADQKNRKTYTKKNLDDTRVRRKTDLDAYKPAEDESMIEGMEDYEANFEFSEEDIDRINHENLIEAEEKEKRKKAGRKKRKKAAMQSDNEDSSSQDAVRRSRKRRRREEAYDDDPDEGETVIISMRNRSQLNKEISRVNKAMVLVFMAMIVYFIYFNAFVSKDIINNPYNSRIAMMADKIARGKIYAADGEVLADTMTDDDGDSYRYYPYSNAFAHVVGTVDVNKSGIELAEDYALSTTDIIALEKVYNEIRGDKNPGNDVYTSLDTDLQLTAYEALGDEQGAIVAIEPSTGKVLAMVSKPDYDPNSLSEYYNEIINDEGSKVLLNQVTSGLFVPGSIFKTVTTLAYLRSRQYDPDYEYECDGYISLDSDDDEASISCYDGEVHGTVDLKDSFAESCNSSFANIGLKLGPAQLKETAEDLFFNMELPTAFSTVKSSFALAEGETDWQIGATAIGQGDTVITPMHAAMLAAAIANKGTVMEPYVITDVKNSDGSVIESYSPKTYGNIMSRSEAATMTDLMKGVVDYGTGYYLSDEWYDVAGKTGTAEVVDSGNNAWFIGFAPADDPKIAVCVLVENTGTASSTAVPIAGALFDSYLD